eukprot:1689943-Pyramimonas_sp.AAC.1
MELVSLILWAAGGGPRALSICTKSSRTRWDHEPMCRSTPSMCTVMPSAYTSMLRGMSMVLRVRWSKGAIMIHCSANVAIEHP